MRNEQLIKKQSIPHDSAIKHVSGFADYTDDISEPLNILHGAIILKPAFKLEPIFTFLASPDALEVIVVS